jgi:multidrug efflux pump subunit AcrA (membrane-fusion protein)
MVHEADIARVTTNMPATVRIPALNNLEFTGRVQVLGGVGRDRAEVGPNGVEGNVSGVTVFNAMVSLDQTDERLRPGMSAAVYIESLPVASRLVLPRSAVGEFCAADSAGRVRLENGEVRAVTGRHIGDNLFWIQDGLNEGERVKRNFEN